MEFIVLTIVSIIVVILILRYALNSRDTNPIDNYKIIGIIIILEIFCMLLGKYGANWGFPWWIYYPIPMLITIFLPTIYFKMNKIETIKYTVLILISAPFIHTVFSFFGWKNFMPFIKIPSIFELIK